MVGPRVREAGGAAGPWATGGTGLLEAQMARLARLLSSLLILLFTKTENNKRKEKRKEKVRGRIWE